MLKYLLIFFPSVLLIIYVKWNCQIICCWGFFDKSLDHLHSKHISFYISKQEFISVHIFSNTSAYIYIYGGMPVEVYQIIFPSCSVAGNEGLLACKLLPSTPCVLHCRVHAGAVALWFRSSCSALPDYLSCHCQKMIETS